MRKWLEDNSCNDLFSSSSSKTEEEEGDRSVVVSSGGSGDSDDDDSNSCMEMVRRIDGIANRAESMYNMDGYRSNVNV